MTRATAVASVRQGARKRMFMSVVVSASSGPVRVRMAKAAALSASVMRMPPCREAKMPSCSRRRGMVTVNSPGSTRPTRICRVLKMGMRLMRVMMASSSMVGSMGGL